MPRVSLRDIARKLNVSHATVSLALRDHPRISKECRQRVQKVARELGYHPDPMLSALIAYRKGKRTNTISATLGWLNRWPDPRGLRCLHEFDAYWEGARSAAEQAGYRLEEFVLGSGMTARRLQRILATRAVHGLLIPPHPPATNWTDFDLDWSQFALVRFGFSVPEIRTHLVANDQMRSAELAVRRMAELGYGRIGYVTAEAQDRAAGGNFRAGYEHAIEALEGAPRIEPLNLPYQLGASPRQSANMLRRWLARFHPDAILTSDPGLHPALAALGYRIPEEIALAATSVWDGGSIDAGLDQNPHEIGRVAVHLLVDLLNHHELGNPAYCRRILVEGKWTDGGSLPSRRT